LVGRAIATKKGCTASQLCLAWILAQGGDFIPIPGTKNEKYLRENLGALNVVLTKKEIAEIDAIIEHLKAVGDRSVRSPCRAYFRAHDCLPQVWALNERSRSLLK